MNHYNRLTLEERYQIQALKKSEISCRKIAEQLNRSHSTILREINNNLTNQGIYVPEHAFKNVKLVNIGIVFNFVNERRSFWRVFHRLGHKS